MNEIIQQVRQERGISDYPADVVRPKKRSDCEGGIRPCPFVSCRHNLFLDVTFAGGISLNYPGKEPDELEHSCALDEVVDGGMTLAEVGVVMEVSREQIRQVEEKAQRKLRHLPMARRLRPDREITKGLVDPDLDDDVEENPPVGADRSRSCA